MSNGDLQQIRKWIQSVSDKVKKIDEKLDNHLVSIGKEITEIKTDMSWIKKFFWIIMTVSIGAILTAVFSIILK